MNKKVILTMFLLVFCFTSVKAENNYKDIYKVFETPTTKSYFNSYSNAKSASHNGGIVTYKNMSDDTNLNYYDTSGNLIKSVKINIGNYQVFYMESYKENLYILTGYNDGDSNEFKLYKYDKDLAFINSIRLGQYKSEYDEIEYSYIEPYWNFNYGSDYLAFDENNIIVHIGNLNHLTDEEDRTCNIILVDYNLKSQTFPENYDEYTEKYFLYNSYPGNEYIDEIEDYDNYIKYISYYKKDDLLAITMQKIHSVYDENEESEIHYPYAVLEINNNNDKKTIENKDYTLFKNVSVWNDMIVLIASKEYNSEESYIIYQDDILFYDLEGNYLGEITSKNRLHYLSTTKDHLVFNEEKNKQLCTYDDYYSYDYSYEDYTNYTGCSSTSKFVVYSINKKGILSENSNNPETSSKKILPIVIISIISIIAIIKYYKKVKYIK